MAEKISNKVDRLIQAMNMGFPQNEWVGILESILDGFSRVAKQQFWLAPDTAATNNGATQKDLNGITAGFSMVAPLSPDYPRNIQITGVISNGAITELVCVITGTDIFGAVATETITIDDDETVIGSVVFATLTSIAVTGTFSTGGGASDTLDAGYGVKMGLLGNVESDCMVKMNMDEADVGADDVTIDDTNNSITFETAPNASRDYIAWYVTKA